jgi:predicted O-methyltransferase YrrM
MLKSPCHPIEISPFLCVRQEESGDTIRDLASTISIRLTKKGAGIFKAIELYRSSYALSEFLFATMGKCIAETTDSLSDPTGCWQTDDNLRFAPTALVSNYLKKTSMWRQIGNRSFAPLAAYPFSASTISDPIRFTQPRGLVTIHHSWKPGFFCLEDDSSACNQMADYKMSKSVYQTLSTAGWLSGPSIDLSMLVAKVQTAFIAIQNPIELQEFLMLVLSLRPKVVVEIGTARGGLLYSLCQVAARDALLISIDLPGSPNGGGQDAMERALFGTFGYRTQTIKILSKDSHSCETRDLLAKILHGRKIDLLIIDGDHSFEGVERDFLMYKQFVRKKGLIALHDILMFSAIWGSGNDVGDFWNAIKQGYEHCEIIDQNGVCLRDSRGKTRSWGFGLIKLA